MAEESSWPSTGPLGNPASGRVVPVGRVIADRYELRGELGRGAMGVVHRALDRDIGREVAVKLIRADDVHPERVERFRREARLLGALDHPGIVRVHDAGLREELFLVCELVEGARTLAAILRELPRARRAELVRDAARAVGHAHARGVVHRDLKPSNLLVDPAGRLRVIDFGLATATGSTERLTQTGSLLGTPLYMSPEQVLGRAREVGPAADVWALGVMLYEALTGDLPFNGVTFVELADRICAGRPSLPCAIDSTIEPALEAVCLRALRVDPAERWPDGEAMASALDAALSGAPPQGRARSRAPALAMAGGVGGGLLVAALVVASGPRADRHPARAPRPNTASDVQPGPTRVSPPEPARWRAVGLAHEHGAGAVKDPALAAAASRRAAEAGDVPSMRALARLLSSGDERGPRRDEVEAAGWWSRAAAAGDPEAMLDLAAALEAGRGRPAGPGAAAAWRTRAVEAGCLRALVEDGERHLRAGRREQALASLRRAAVRGHPAGMRALGLACRAELPPAGDEALGWLAAAAARGDIPALVALGDDLPDAAARAWYRRLVEAGHLIAAPRLAALLRAGRGGPPAPAEGIAWLRRGAEAGVAEAMMALSTALEVGEDTEADLAEAFSWLLRAADAGSPLALTYLAELHRTGAPRFGVERDPERAFELFRSAATSGHASAMHQLGACYANGVGVRPDLPRAREWLGRAAEGGYPAAMTTFGALLLFGEGGDPDPAAGHRWLERAAELGQQEAMLRLGYAYQQGQGVPVDDERSFAWFRRAAEAGSAEAMNAVGVFFSTGRGSVAEDPLEAARWYLRAANASYLPAMTNYAGLLMDGRIPTDEVDAVHRWLERAANGGEPGAMVNLGAHLIEGHADHATAATWYRRAAEAGQPVGMCNLAGLYSAGLGVPRDLGLAASWYRRAADAGSAQGMHAFAEMLAGGEGVARDEAAAVALWRRAAEAGLVPAMVRLAEMLRDGRGVAADPAAARRWLERAAAGGDEAARGALEPPRRASE